MPRAIWSGVVSFGLVNISVKLYTAVQRKNVRFNQIDARTGSRIRNKRFSAADDTEVPQDQIVKGYEIAAGEYVIVEDDELAALDPAAQRTIDIEEFVDLADIDPIFYDTTYYVAPGPQMAKPYRLLVEAMTAQDKVAIAHFVMRTKQYVAALRPVEDRLVLSTMIYADEIADPMEIPELHEVADVEVQPRELEMANQLIESLARDFDPERYHDTYREQVLALIHQKAAGEHVVQAIDADVPPTNVIDLISALEASIAERKATRDRHPTALEGTDDDTGEPEGIEAASSGEDDASTDDTAPDVAAPAMKQGGARRQTPKKAAGRKPASKTKKKASAAAAKRSSVKATAEKAPGKTAAKKAPAKASARTQRRSA